MSAGNIGEIKATITGDASGLEKAAVQSIAALQKLSNTVDTIKTGIGAFKGEQQAVASLGEAFGPVGLAAGAAAAGIGLVVTALAGAAAAMAAFTASAVRDFAAGAETIQKLADQTKMSTDAIQKLQITAEIAGVSVTGMATAITRMEKELAQGSGVFQQLGLSIEQLKKMAPEEAFRKVAEAIVAIRDPLQRTAAEMEVFGARFGTKMETLIKAMGTGEQAAKDFGLVIGSETIKHAADLDDQLDVLRLGFENLTKQFSATVVESGAVDAVLKAMHDGLLDLTKLLVEHKDDLRAFFVDVAGLIVKVVAEIKPLVEWLTKAASAVAVLIKLSPAGQVAAGVAGLYEGLTGGPAENIPGEAFGGFATGAGKGTGHRAPSSTFYDAAWKEHAKEAAAAMREALREAEAAQAELNKATALSLATYKRQTEESYKETEFLLKTMVIEAQRAAKEVDKTIRSTLEGLTDKDAWARLRESILGGYESKKALAGMGLVDVWSLSAKEAEILERHVLAIEASTRKWGAAVQSLAAGFQAIGVSADSVFGKILSGVSMVIPAFGKLSTLAAGPGGFFKQLTGSVTNFISGIGAALQGAGAAIEIGKAIFSLFSSPTIEDAAAQAGARLGQAVTKGMIDAIRHISVTLHVDVMGAADLYASLLGLDKTIRESDKSALDFAVDFAHLMEAVAKGIIPAKQGLLEIGKVFDQMIETAEQFGAQGAVAIGLIVKSVEAAGLKFPEFLAFIKKLASEGGAALKTLFDQVAAGVDKDASKMKFFGMIANDLIAGLQAAGMSLIDILDQIGPAIDAAIAAAAKSGTPLSGALAQVAALRDFINAHKELLTLIEAEYQAMLSIVKAGWTTAETAKEFGLQVAADIQALLAQGATMDQIMAIMGPSLLLLAALEKQFGFTVDDATQKLIDEAKAQEKTNDPAGIHNMQGALEGIVVLLALMVQAFGVHLPEALQIFLDKWIEVHTQQKEHPLSGPPKPGGSSGEEGEPKPGPGGGAAHEGFFPATPGGYNVNLAEGGEGEYVLKQSTVKALAAGGVGVGGGGVYISVNGAADPRAVGQAVAEALAARYGPLVTAVRYATTGRP